MMNVMAPTMRSPMPPYEQQRRQSLQSVHSQRHSYPTSPHPDASNHGLGLFPCTMAPPPSTIGEITASPTPTANWPHPALMEQPSYSQSQPPDIFSAAFDPFSGFPSSSNTGMVGAHSPEAPGLDYCHTPPSPNMPSHRGSVSSSYAASDAYSQSGSDCAYTPRVKVEEAGGEWYPAAGNEHILQRALSSHGPLTYPVNPSPLAGHTEDLYRAQPAEWSKGDTPGYMTELHASPDGRLPRFEVQSITVPSATRIKKKRQRTTPEEATHECRVCGKLFKRSYNWKSHLETHNPERKYPHPCTATVGNSPCTKKFQRKTDLDRHHDSVHLKARNHKCALCGHSFARRDTLRRHTEDGCPKRFELGIRDPATALGPNPASLAPHASARWSFASFPPRPRSYSVGLPHNSPMAPPGSANSSATFPMFTPRPEYAPQSSPAYGS